MSSAGKNREARNPGGDGGAEAQRRRAVDFERIDQLRAHEYVADQLRRHIALHLVHAGEALPPERSLARTFGVGRATIQRGLAILESEGLIDRRRGRGGGTFVLGREQRGHRHDPMLKRVIANRDEIEDALLFRAEIEPAVAAHAVTSADSPATLITEAAKLTATATNEEEAARYDSEFHLAIARATGNRFFVEAVERTRLVLAPVLAALPESRLWYERTAREHLAIAEAVEAGDEDGARMAMRAHVAHTEKSVRALLAALPGA